MHYIINNKFFAGLFEDYLESNNYYKKMSKEKKRISIKTATENLTTEIRDEREALLKLINSN